MGGEDGRRAWLPLLVGGVAWLSMVGMGMAMLWQYAVTPGAPAAPPVRWPADSLVPRRTGGATLVMMAHPRCACTRASLGELARLMARAGDRVRADVLFFKPASRADDWAMTDLWRSAAAIPGVTPLLDEGGVEAGRFRASTSGQVVLYDAAGQLLFSGGITDARGHAGDNQGSDAILSLLTEGRADRTVAPVFGCSLLEPCPDGAAGPAACAR